MNSANNPASGDGEQPKKKKRIELPIVSIKNTADYQRMKLERLMANPDKAVIIPDRPKEKKGIAPPPDFVRNIMGSSAGAGSGEFHVYRHLRRKEYARQKEIQEKAEQERREEEYKSKVEEKKKKAEEKTAKKRAKRLKQKERMKQNKLKKMQGGKPAKTSSSSSEDSEEEEQLKEAEVGANAAGDASSPKNGTTVEGPQPQETPAEEQPHNVHEAGEGERKQSS